MAAVSRQTIRREARQLEDLISTAAEVVPAADLPQILTVLRQARVAIESVRRRTETGAADINISPERWKVYFPPEPAPGRTVSEAERQTADAAWEEALVRGYRHREQALTAIGPVLTPGEVAARLGVSTVTINNWRRRGRLLAIRFDDYQYLYPAYQFATTPAEGEQGVLRHFGAILAELGVRPAWTKAQFFVTPAPYLSGRTPLALLRGGRPDDIERVRQLAREAGEMGS